MYISTSGKGRRAQALPGGWPPRYVPAVEGGAPRADTDTPPLLVSRNLPSLKGRDWCYILQRLSTLCVSSFCRSLKHSHAPRVPLSRSLNSLKDLLASLPMEKISKKVGALVL